MKLKQVALLCVAVMGLQACASPYMMQNLRQGKSHFLAGDYKQSFRELLPLASDGNAAAQYAIGYMYYYGYGVLQDKETGQFWIERSASQHYIPALTALKTLHP